MPREQLRSLINNGRLSEVRKTAFQEIKALNKGGLSILEPALYYCRASRMTGNYVRAETVGEIALNATNSEDNVEGSLRAKLMVEMGNVLRMKRMYTESITQMEFARSYALLVGDKETAAQALWGIGIAHRVDGDNEGAEQLFHKALGECREIEDKTGGAHCLREIGIVRSNLGDSASAVQHLTEALRIYEETGFKLGASHAKRELAVNFHRLGDGASAESFFEQALLGFIEGEARLGEANTYKWMGHFYRDNGNHDKANELFDKATKLFTALGDFRSLEQMKKEIESSATVLLE